jgi:hypothetical protein
MARGIFTLKQQLQGLQQRAWSGTMTTPAVDYLVVAGGGGGGVYWGGGGGAGGLLQGAVPITAGTSYTVTVGSGGTASSVTFTNGGSGLNSVFGNISATGGAGGISYASSVITTGGSGGGGSVFINKTQGITGQGNGGGAGGLNGIAGENQYAGGGGGAGTSGLDGVRGGSPYNYGGAGGAGIASAISGTVTAYAGGGGGAGNNGLGVGGVGGGGAANTTSNATAGAANTGGGGGGQLLSPSSGTPTSGAGGSGIVIVSYPDVYAAAAGTTGSPTVSTSGSGSVAFSGTGQYLSTPSNSGFAFGTGDLTVEAWIYANSLSGERGFFQTSATAGGLQTSYTDGLILVANPAGNGINANLGNTTISTGNAITINTWYHVAFTRSSGSCRLFINGVLFAGPTNITTNVTGTYAAIGGYYTNSFLWNGNISNLRVVKGTAVYTSAFTPSTVPLTAISGTSLMMNTVSGAQFADSSSNSLTLTATGSPAWNQASPFATGLGYKNRVYTWTSSGSITF